MYILCNSFNLLFIKKAEIGETSRYNVIVLLCYYISSNYHIANIVKPFSKYWIKNLAL